MDKKLESRWEKETDALFRNHGERVEDLIGKNWKHHLKYFLEYFSRHIKKDNSKTLLLDIGCGIGLVAEQLAKNGFQVYGVDFSSETIKFAQNRSAGIDYRRSSIYDLPFSNEMFDIIICLGVFQTVTDPAKAFKEIVRVLKKGGTLVVRTLNALSLFSIKARKDNPFYIFYNPLHFRKEMEKNGFKVHSLKGIYSFPCELNSLGGLIIKTKLYKVFNLLFIPIFMFFSHNFYIEGTKNEKTNKKNN